MPAIYAHIQFGETVIKALPPTFSHLVEKYPEAFALGTQGPNLLKFHHPFKGSPVRTLGSHMHDVASEAFFLDAGKHMIQNTKTDILQDNGAYASYILGFLTHFVLDTVCHAPIHALQDEHFSHNKIEAEFDKYQLRQAGKPTRGYNPATALVNETEAVNACSEALGVPTEDIELCIKTIRRSAWWFSNKSVFLHGFAHGLLFFICLERRLGDLFFRKKDHPLSEQSNQILSEKYALAVDKAKKLIEDYFSNLPKAVEEERLNDFFRYNYSGAKYYEDKTTE